MLHKLLPRQRAPYNGTLNIACDVCRRGVDVREGYFSCADAESNCDYDICWDCFKGRKPDRVKIIEEKDDYYDEDEGPIS